MFLLRHFRWQFSEQRKLFPEFFWFTQIGQLLPINIDIVSLWISMFSKCTTIQNHFFLFRSSVHLFYILILNCTHIHKFVIAIILFLIPSQTYVCNTYIDIFIYEKTNGISFSFYFWYYFRSRSTAFWLIPIRTVAPTSSYRIHLMRFKLKREQVKSQEKKRKEKHSHNIWYGSS